jgi:hypothetical protein
MFRQTTRIADDVAPRIGIFDDQIAASRKREEGKCAYQQSAPICRDFHAPCSIYWNKLDAMRVPSQLSAMLRPQNPGPALAPGNELILRAQCVERCL